MKTTIFLFLNPVNPDNFYIYKTKLTLLFLLVSLFFVLPVIYSPSVKANPLSLNNTQNNTHIQINRHNNSLTLPKHYIEILSHFNVIKNKMDNDIKKGNGQKWISYLEEGIKRNESLYWWLLSNWYYQTGNLDKSYSAAVRALVITRMEQAVCGTRKQLEWVLEQLSDVYNQAAGIDISKNEITQSILNSVSWGTDMMNENQIIHGMSCYMKQIKDAQKNNHRVKIKIEDWNSSSISHSERKSRLRRQGKALQDIRNDFSYKKVLKGANAEQVWNSVANSKTNLP